MALSERVPLASLAKRIEEIYLPDRLDSVLLPRRSEALYLVQRARDEAHRFAITSHRKQRQKKGLASRLGDRPRRRS